MGYYRDNRRRYRGNEGNKGIDSQRSKDINDDDFSALAQSALERIKSGEDLEDLERLKKVFKKAVPWGIRNYLGVYMTRLWLQKHGTELPPRAYGAPTQASIAGKDDGTDRGERTRHEFASANIDEERQGTKPQWEPREQREPRDSGETKRATIPAEEAATVYIGVGRTRRVSKGNIITLLAKVAGLDRARIGEIRILDSYTFVQLYAVDADSVIAKLDGYEFHGKGLSVGYSRKDQDE